MTLASMRHEMGYGINQRFVTLDVWRGIAAISVAWLHFGETVHIDLPAFIPNAWILVDFFFVLSGFVIMHAYGRKVCDARSALAFLIKRFGRLWPLHVSILAILVFMEIGKLFLLQTGTTINHPPFSGAADMSAILPHIFLLQAFIPVTWNGPSWSIGCEFVAYITFALVLMALCTVTII